MKESPYFNINYGWPYGADGWNIGMDENLLVLSFLNTHSVIDIVPDIPDFAMEGDSYVLSTDNSARFFADGVWNILYPSDGWEFTTLVGGNTWVYEGGVPVPRVNPDDLSQSVQDLQEAVEYIDSQLEDVNSALTPLEGLPARVTELENTSASEEDLQSLTGRVETLEGSVDDLDSSVDSLSVRVESLEDSIIDVSEELNSKLESVVAGEGVTVDNTDPLNPVISATSSGGGASSFTGLSDTPSTYAGFEGYYVRVNADGTGLEFVNEISGGTY